MLTLMSRPISRSARDDASGPRAVPPFRRSAPSSAAFIVCHGRLAHFTRVGYCDTPENTASLPKVSESAGDGPPVTRPRNRSNSSSASRRDLPFTAAVISDAEAREIAQPSP